MADLIDAAAQGKTWFDGKPEMLVGTVKRFERALASERFLDGAITRAYQGRPMLPTGSTATTTGTADLGKASAYLTGLETLTQENLLRSAVETIVSQIVRDPAVKVITTEGTWSEQVSARKLSLLMTSVIERGGFKAHMAPCLIDSLNTMVAFTMWAIDEGRPIRCERVLPHQVSWNPSEGQNPRTLCIRHGVPRRTIANQFLGETVNGRKIEQRDIDLLPAYQPSPEFFLDHTWQYLVESDLVEVCEAWRTDAGDKDRGRHVIASGNTVLLDKEWRLDFWPLVPQRWSDSYDTFGGVPGARFVLAAQMRVNRMNRTIDESTTKCSVPYWLNPRGCEATGMDTNAIGRRVDYNADGGRPEMVQGVALLPEYYNEASRVRGSVYELLGVSQSIATATKEPGVDSGRAQRERYNIASGRLVNHASRFEAWIAENVRVAMLLMAHTKGHGIADGEMSRLSSEIDWDKVTAAKGSLSARAYITSAIPVEPSGRAETLDKWVQDGVISAKRATRWFADPDTASIEDDESAVEDLVRKYVDTALYDGEALPLEPAALGTDGLQMLATLTQQSLCKALCRDTPETNLELLRRLQDATNEAIKAATPAPPPAAPAGAPGMPPGAPPVGAPPPGMVLQ